MLLISCCLISKMLLNSFPFQENTSSHHLALTGLSPCTSYTFIVIPYVGTYEASKDEDESVRTHWSLNW